MGILSILRQRHLTILWIGQLLSALGDQFYMAAVIWLAVQIGGSAGGTVIAAGTASRFVFGLLGGVCADRWDRRKTMMMADVVRGAAVMTIPLVARAGDPMLWHLALVAVVIGAADSLFNPALQASLPALVDDKQALKTMVVVLSMTRRLAKAAGPAMFGALAALLPITTFFTLDTISFAVSAIAILMLGTRFQWTPEPQETNQKGITGIVGEIKGAIAAILHHKPLSLGLATFGLGLAFWSAGFMVGIPLLVDQVLHADAEVYGFIAAAYGLGNVASNIVIGSMKIERRVFVMFSGWIVLGAGFMVVAMADTVWIAMLGAFIGAFGGPMNDILLVVNIQTEMPGNQIGKVFSLYMLLASVGTSVGLLLAGPLFVVVSVPVGIAITAVGMVACGMVGVLRFGLVEPQVQQRAGI